MTRLLALVVALVGCAEDPMAPPPDAHPKTVSDYLYADGCDQGWADYCTLGCRIQPQASPCDDPGVACLSKPACAAATYPGVVTVDCAATFVVSDFEGEHTGCCIPFHPTSSPDKTAQLFYECQP